MKVFIRLVAIASLFLLTSLSPPLAAAYSNVQNTTRNDLIEGSLGLIALIVVFGLPLWFFERIASTELDRSRYQDLKPLIALAKTDLPETKIYIESSCSPLVDTNIRRQWSVIENNFLQIEEDIKELGGLHSGSSDGDLRKNHKRIRYIYGVVSATLNAEKNITKLAALEYGYGGARAEALETLLQDVDQCTKAVKSRIIPRTIKYNKKELLAELEEQTTLIESLNKDLRSNDFASSYAEILRSYAITLDKVIAYLYTGSRIKKRLANSARIDNARWGKYYIPQLSSTNWTPGEGSFYVQFDTIAGCHGDGSGGCDGDGGDGGGGDGGGD